MKEMLRKLFAGPKEDRKDLTESLKKNSDCADEVLNMSKKIDLKALREKAKKEGKLTVQ